MPFPLLLFQRRSQDENSDEGAGNQVVMIMYLYGNFSLGVINQGPAVHFPNWLQKLYFAFQRPNGTNVLSIVYICNSGGFLVAWNSPTGCSN